VVPFETKEVVLLIHQFRHAAGGTIWEVPAGKLDGDRPEVCAAKELEEEAGRRAGRLERLGSIWTTPGFTDEVIHLFAAFDLEPIPQRLESDEVIEVVPTPIGEALEMIWRGELRDAKSVVALIHAARRIGLLP
jgi:ADP-ribose pyrophosphatase